MRKQRIDKGIPRKIEYKGKTAKLWGVYKDLYYARRSAYLIGGSAIIKKFSGNRYAVYKKVRK